MRIGSGRGDGNEHVLDQLSAYIDYELADAERERVRDHLRRCPPCENELATLRATKQLLTESPLHPVPRSFVLTSEMVGRGVTGPVERRRSFGWTLAGRLRTASALIAVLLVLVLSGDLLTRSGLASSSAALPLTSSSAPAPNTSQVNGITPPLLLEAMPTTTTAAPAAAGAAPPADGLTASAPATEMPVLPAPTSAAGDAFATNGAQPPSTDAAPAPVQPLNGITNPETTGPDQAYRFFIPTVTSPAGKGATAEATPAPSVNGWQLAEGALLILLLVLGGGALWARARGV